MTANYRAALLSFAFLWGPCHDELLASPKSLSPEAQYLRDFYKTHIVGRNSSELSHIAKMKDDVIAVSAYWEMHRVLKIRTRTKWGPQYVVEPAHANKFVGFLEGRTGGSPPQWWADELADLNLGAYLPNSKEVELYQSGDNVRAVRAIPRKILLADEIEYSLAKEGISLHHTERGKIFLTRDVIKQICPSGDHNQFDYFCRDDLTVLASYSHTHTQISLFCFSIPDMKLKWSAKTLGLSCRPDRPQSGIPSHHSVRVSIADKAVLIWGSQSFATYLEEFDLRSGISGFKFYSDVMPRRKLKGESSN